MCVFPQNDQDKHTTFDESEGILVSTLDEMRSLWQEFVRTKAADTAVSIVKQLVFGCAHVYLN